MMKTLSAGAFLAFLFACNISTTENSDSPVPADKSVARVIQAPVQEKALIAGDSIDTRNMSPEPVIAFAKTLIGVPYKYGSTDPAAGFDCSGFITYVFNHFDIAVPRSSVDFTNVGTTVDAAQSRAGDLILFTGTDTLKTAVGHMGIVTENSDSLRFIHSTSGKKYGVTVTALNEYYAKRFVKVIRIFN